MRPYRSSSSPEDWSCAAEDHGTVGGGSAGAGGAGLGSRTMAEDAIVGRLKVGFVVGFGV